jgi:hypothetical protein
MNFEAGNSAIVTGLPLDRSELEKLARRIPAKEMALLFEIFDRARKRSRFDEACSAPLLGLRREGRAYADQDPLYTITRRIKDRLEPLPERHAA